MRANRSVLGVVVLTVTVLGACGVDTEGVGVEASSPGASGTAGKGGGAAGSGGSSGAQAGSAGKAGGAAGTGGKGGAAGNAAGSGGGAGSGGKGGAGGSAGIAGAAGNGNEGGAAGIAAGGNAGQGGQAGASGVAGTGQSGAAGAGNGGGSGAGNGGGSGAGNGGAAGADNGGAAGAGNGGAAGAGNGGAAGAGNAGTAGAAGVAGAAGAAGQAGSAGASGGAGIAGSAGNAGVAGAAGTAGAGGSPSTCGNGVFDPGEACEDGNLSPDDGCSPTCTLECPAEGKIVNGHCYFLTSETQLGTDVRGKTKIGSCSGRADHIADALNVADLADIYEALGTRGSDKWIALTFQGNNGQGRDRSRWSWNELGESRDSLWATNEPSSSANGGPACGAVWEQTAGSLRLDDAPCANARQVICEREPICVVDGRLGWVGRDGHCYYTVDTPLGFTNASNACTGKARLAAFETLAERETLGGLGFGNTWIGGEQKGSSASVSAGWTWTTSPEANPPDISATTPSIVWHPGEPNDVNGGENGQEDCLQLYPTRRYNDEGCTQSHLPLCELVP